MISNKVKQVIFWVCVFVLLFIDSLAPIIFNFTPTLLLTTTNGLLCAAFMYYAIKLNFKWFDKS